MIMWIYYESINKTSCCDLGLVYFVMDNLLQFYVVLLAYLDLKFNFIIHIRHLNT